MGQKYKVDRLNLITFKGQKKKTLKSLRCRYMAKSHVVKCDAQSQLFEYINFRGSHFKKVNFKSAMFDGCDFWGTSFRECNFQKVKFRDCIFMADIFRDCDFTGAEFSYCVIVNTNLSDCYNIDISAGVSIYSTYPTFDLTPELKTTLDVLKDNKSLRKNKLLFISDTRYNQLNLFLLQRRYAIHLSQLLLELNNHSTSKITTYKKLERELNKIFKSTIM